MSDQTPMACKRCGIVTPVGTGHLCAVPTPAQVTPDDIEAIRAAAAKLRVMARVFMGDDFTDRYGDGPSMMAHSERLESVISTLTGVRNAE